MNFRGESRINKGVRGYWKEWGGGRGGGGRGRGRGGGSRWLWWQRRRQG